MRTHTARDIALAARRQGATVAGAPGERHRAAPNGASIPGLREDHR
jgi:hypothetical protein